MSLDRNLFTLIVTPSTSNDLVTDLVDTEGRVHYCKERKPGMVYSFEIYDPLSGAIMASATAPSATSKHKTLQLYNPDKVVELRFVGTLNFRWAFAWEGHDFEWKRDECFIVRKPDPAVLVAIAKELSAKAKTISVQLLDYNLNRFDIEDRKGLDIIILTGLLTFQDASEAYHDPSLSSVSPPQSKSVTPIPLPPPLPNPISSTPLLPPRPVPRTGIDRVAEMQAARGEVNEVAVFEEGSVHDYAQYCVNLLEDDAMLFITIRSGDSEQVHKVLQVLEEAKNIRRKSGKSKDEMHQYVVFDNDKALKSSQQIPKYIDLNDVPSKNKTKNMDRYIPPDSLAVHLSKIDIPELQPRARDMQQGKSMAEHGWSEPANSKGKSRESADSGGQQARKERERQEREREKEEKKLKAGKKGQISSYLSTVSPSWS